MSRQDDLFDLIRALTPPEKRYFRLQAGKESKSSYMRLFEAMDSLPEFDEERLKKKLQGDPLLKYLSAEKRNLHEQIVQTMRTLGSDRSADHRIMDLLMEDAFMRSKGLMRLRGKALERAEALARKYERYSLLAEVLWVKKDYITEVSTGGLSAGVDEVLDSIQVVQQTQRAYWSLMTLNSAMFTLYRSGADMKNAEVRARLDGLLAEAEAIAKDGQGPVRIRMLYHAAVANYFNCIGNRAECFAHTAAVLTLYEAHPHLAEEDGQSYKTTIANYLVRAHATGQYGRFEELLARLKSLPQESLNAEGEVFQNVYFLEHLYYINNGRFEEATALVPEIEQGLLRYSSKINKAREMSFRYNIMVMFFLLHQFKEAKRWCEMLLDEKSDIRRDIQTSVRILYPVICYELGKFDIIESVARSSYRYLLAQQRLHEFERLVVRYLQTMPFSPDDIDFHKKLSAFDRDIGAIRTEEGFRPPAGMEEVTLWIRSKKEGVIMTSLL